MERRIGYARSASANQGVESQIQALKAAGCSEIFSDIGATGLMLARPGLIDAMLAVKTGDEFLVMDMDRISRSRSDLYLFVDRLMGQHVELKTLLKPDEAKAIETLVNYPSALFAKPGLVRTALHRASVWLATVIRRVTTRLRA